MKRAMPSTRRATYFKSRGPARSSRLGSFWPVSFKVGHASACPGEPSSPSILDKLKHVLPRSHRPGNKTDFQMAQRFQGRSPCSVFDRHFVGTVDDQHVDRYVFDLYQLEAKLFFHRSEEIRSAGRIAR